MTDTTIGEDAIAPFLGKESLFPEKRHPFYVVAPPYTRSSAGVRAVHFICHALNAIGQPAYLIIYPPLYRRNRTNLDWNTPLLTPDLAAHHFKQRLTPLVIYPETVRGNPLNATAIMRYVMNYPGLLGGDKTFPPNEILYGYSQQLANAAGAGNRVLFVPVSDTTIFYPPPKDAPPRKGTCFWASKYQIYHGGTLFPITEGSVEITRDRPDSQTPEQIVDLFRRSEIFYSYENTALAIEALLCGCPTVLLPNEYFTQSIGLDELGWDGFAWGSDPKEVERACKTVSQGRANYLRLNDQFWHQLVDMVNVCHAHAAATPYARPIATDVHNTWVQAKQLTQLSLRYWRTHGSQALAKKMFKIIRRDGWLSLFQRGADITAYAVIASLTNAQRKEDERKKTPSKDTPSA